MACKPDEQKRLTVVPGHGDRQPGADGGDAGHVHALRAVGLAAAEDHVFDLGRVELRHLAEHVRDAVGGQVVGPGQVERAAKRLGQRRPRAGNDDGFSHSDLLSGFKESPARLGP